MGALGRCTAEDRAASRGGQSRSTFTVESQGPSSKVLGGVGTAARFALVCSVRSVPDSSRHAAVSHIPVRTHTSASAFQVDTSTLEALLVALFSIVSDTPIPVMTVEHDAGVTAYVTAFCGAYETPLWFLNDGVGLGILTWPYFCPETGLSLPDGFRNYSNRVSCPILPC